MASIHGFSVEGLARDTIDFSDFSGKKLMLVNVASECGFTIQYKQLQELYEYYGDRLMIVGFPCDDFGGQEPGSAEEIVTFCQRNFGVSFPLTRKIRITEDRHPIYQWLCEKARNDVMDSEVTWNFHKYLINEQGQLVMSLAPEVDPLSETIIDWLESD